MVNFKNFIQFKVNGVSQIVNNEFGPETTLNEYIRDYLNLKGTKVTCNEGGCGVCIVNGTYYDHTENEYKSTSVNSCIFPLYSCNNWEFTTIEGIGSRSTKLHPIQKRLADHNGSQCGFCSPGFVMSMYSLLKNNPKPDKQTIENSFDGNICRCTGYRPILDAMKSFAENESPIDIEDLHQMKCLNNCSDEINNNCGVLVDHKKSKWYAPVEMIDLLEVIQKHKNDQYKLVAGNTAKGLFKTEIPDLIYINIQNVKELYEVKFNDSSLVLGANLTLTSLIELFNKTSKNQPGFEYLSEFSQLIKKIANTSVRNVASWAGNLILKRDYDFFPSDLFIAFKTIDAKLTIKSLNEELIVSLDEFLKIDMNGRFIKSIEINKQFEKIIKFYKVMPRSQGSHSYVTAGFSFSILNDHLNQVPKIVFGGLINPYFESKITSEFLNGNNLKESFQESCKLLHEELNDENNYNKSLALSIYYKFVLSIVSDLVDSRFKSALDSINDTREISKGEQLIPSNPELYPLTKPIPKTNSYAQTSGEAVYNSDLIAMPGQLNGALILSRNCNCYIQNIDYEKALNAPGVRRVILAKDIPGQNNIFPYSHFIPGSKEELFAEDYVAYAGQPLGLVIADTDRQAKYATTLVNVTYKDHKKPILSIEDAIQENSYHPKTFNELLVGNPDDAIEQSKFKLEGEFSNGGQYHFFLENHVAVSTPTEDGYDIDCGGQWLDYLQKAAGMALNIKNLADIEVKTKQIGGGFGGKASRPATIASAAAVASSLTKRPVRVAPDLNTNMRNSAKRFPQLFKYKVGFDKNGKINGVKVHWYSDAGYLPYDNLVELAFPFFDNAYSVKNIHVIPYMVKTNTPMNTAFRAPFTFPAITLIECIIDNIAVELKLDPLEIRRLNMYKKDDITFLGQKLTYFNVDTVLDKLIDSSEYVKRKNNIDEFNKVNRWKKRGISLIPMKYGAIFKEGYYTTMVTVFNGDGSVALTHGGIEIGQGINTKVAQVCAYELGIPLESINVKAAVNSISPNSQWTGASVTTEIIAKGVIECCRVIKENLEPVRKLMPENYNWKDLVARAFAMNIDLCARYYVTPDKNEAHMIKYDIHAAACSEVLIDVLTGEKEILRTDILYDCGRPLNGLIDIGQAEGAFTIGLGFLFLEKIHYNKQNGRLINDGTWEYLPPLSKDIPVDFRVSFLENSPNPVGILGAKCVGEPPLVLSLSALFACKRAIEAARLENGNTEFFNFDTPITPETIQKLCLTSYTQFNF